MRTHRPRPTAHRPVPRPAAALGAKLLAAAAPLALLAAGCTTASAVALKPERVTIERPLGGTVRVEAAGSPRRAGIGPRAVAGEDVAAALRSALLESGLCSGVLEAGIADHLLRVEVLTTDRTDLQLDMEAAVALRWTLYDGEGHVARWQDVIETRGKSTPMDASAVEDRARLALEEAVRKNLAEGLARLGRARLDPPPGQLASESAAARG